jgi:TM2 domain-containing membrane protein YozV
MVSCPNCQAENPADARYCSNCGRGLIAEQNAPNPSPPPVYGQPQYYQPYPPYQPPYGYPISPAKDPGIAAILALLAGFIGLMGMGHIYVGKITRGLIILVAGLALWALVIASSFAAIITLGGAFWLLILVFIIAALGLLVWQAYDAYNLAKQYNTVLRQTGRPPW